MPKHKNCNKNFWGESPTEWLFDLSLLRSLALLAVRPINFRVTCMKAFIPRKWPKAKGFWASLYDVYEGGSYSRNALWAQASGRSV
jgi:hypothetical protein